MRNEDRSGRGVSARRPRRATRRYPRRLPVRIAPTIRRGPIIPARPVPDRVTLARAVAEVREALAEAAFITAEAAARASSVAEVLASLTVAEGSCLPPATPTTPHADAVLSPREREVLALVAEGQTNKDIASALFVSPNTVKTHVTSLLNKLHATTRVQLATIAARQGLA
jgi:DNA-binding NarL/FixJ family response regulator